MKQIRPLIIIGLLIFLFTLQSAGQEKTRTDLPEGARGRIGRDAVRMIWDIVYSPDGTQFAVATSNGFWLYDAHTYQTLFQLPGHSEEVYTLAFSPDGQVLATGGRDKTIRLWNPHTGQRLAVLTGHTGRISNLAFSHDGLTLSSMNWKDGEIRLWNVKTGKSESTPINLPSNTTFSAFSPDIQIVAVREKDGTIQLWNTKTAKYIATLTGHGWHVPDISWITYNRLPESGGVNRFAFSQDAETLASGGDDSMIRLWDAKKGVHKVTLTGHQARIQSITFSQDGKTLASSAGDHPGWMYPPIGNREDPFKSPDPAWRILQTPHSKTRNPEPTIRLWDAKTGRHRTTIKILNAARLLAFAPDNETLASVDFNSVIQVWNTKTGKQKAILTDHKPGLYAIFMSPTPIFSPDGEKIIFKNRDRTIQLWDVTTGKQQTLLKDNRFPIKYLLFSPNCEMIATFGNRTIQLWDLQTDQRMAIFTGNRRMDRNGNVSFVFSPDSKYAAVVTARMIRLWDTKMGKQTAVFPTGSVFFKFSPDGKMIATTAPQNDIIQLWHTETGHAHVFLRVFERFPSSVEFSPDGKYILLKRNGSSYSLRDIRTGNEIVNYRKLKRNVSKFVFSPDGKMFASTTSPYGEASKNKVVWIWDTETKKHIVTIDPLEHDITQILFSADGETLISENKNATIQLWDIKTGQQITTITEHFGGIEKLLLTANGETLISRDKDGTVRLWDTKKGIQKATLTGHSTKTPLVLSPDGKMLACGGEGSKILVWDTRTGELKKSFTGKYPVKSIVFTKDSKTLVTLGKDGMILLWDLPQ